MRRWRVFAALLVLIASSASAASTAAAPSADPQTLAFGNGAWVFTLTYYGILEGPEGFGGVGTAKGGGTGKLGVKQGVVTGGWTFNVTADVSYQGSGGVLDFSYTGSIDGSPLQPIMIEAGGTNMTMYVSSSTCSQVVGNFSQDAEDIATNVGLGAFFNGKFVAYRTSTAGIEDYEQQAEALITQADMLAQQAMLGNIDEAQFSAVVGQAEDLAAAIKKATKCGTLNKNSDFNLVITQIVADLLANVAANPSSYSTEQISFLIYLGIRVGAIGEGAVNQQFSQSLYEQLEAHFESTLESAIASNNQDEIHQIQVLAEAVGWTGVAQKAADAQ